MPTYRKRPTKVKKPPRIAQTQRVAQNVIVRIEQPQKKSTVRKSAPRKMATKDYQLKSLLTRPLIPPPTQQSFDAQDLARKIALQEQKLDQILQVNAMRVIKETEAQKVGYFGQPTLSVGAPVPLPQQGIPVEQPAPAKPQMSAEEKEAQQAINVATNELGDLKQKAGAFGLTPEILQKERKKLKKSPEEKPTAEERRAMDNIADLIAKMEMDEPSPSPVSGTTDLDAASKGTTLPKEKPKRPETPETPPSTPPAPPRPPRPPRREREPEPVEGLSNAQIQNIMKGVTVPSQATVRKYANALGIAYSRGFLRSEANRRTAMNRFKEVLEGKGY